MDLGTAVLPGQTGGDTQWGTLALPHGQGSWRALGALGFWASAVGSWD